MRFILFIILISIHYVVHAQVYYLFSKDGEIIPESISTDQILDSLGLEFAKNQFYIEAIKNNTPFYDWGQKQWNDTLFVIWPENLKPMPLVILEEDSTYRFWRSYARISRPEYKSFPAHALQMLRYLEDNGYPFAELHLENLVWQNDSFNAVIELNPGPFVSIDSVIIKGESSLINGVLVHQLGLKKGMPYSEAKLKKLQRDINALPYVQTAREPAMLFSKEKNILYLYLEPKKSSAFNALVGVNSGNDGQVILTGEAEVNLLNTFKRAERIYVQWRGPAPGQQNLEARFRMPFLFSSPIGIQASLSMFLQDSSFFSIDNLLGLRYNLGLGSSIGLGWQNSRSGLLDAATATQQGFRDVAVNYFTVDYQWYNIDNFYVPTRGVQLESMLSSGQNTAGEEALSRFKTLSSLEFFIPIYGRQKAYFRSEFFTLRGDALAVNEAMRTGGFTSMRGFNELSFFSNTHLFNNVEYRLFIEEFSFINLFYDLGWIQTAQEPDKTLNLMSLGAGINLNTPQGLFTLLFAIGNTDSQGFQFNNSRVHIGFRNRF